MKTKLFTLILSVLLVFFQVANATLITMEDFSNEAEMDSLLASDDTSITATAVIRAGDLGTGPELRIGNFETFTDNDDIIWNINGDNSFNLSYSGMNGDYDLGVEPDGGDSGSVFSTPTDWFNQLAFTFSGGPVEIDFTGTINGEAFSLNAPLTPVPPSWDGILFTFPEFNANNVGSFNITGTMHMETPFPDLGGDQFRGEFYLIRNDVVPEPATAVMLILGAISTIILRRLKYQR